MTRGTRVRLIAMGMLMLYLALMVLAPDSWQQTLNDIGSYVIGTAALLGALLLLIPAVLPTKSRRRWSVLRITEEEPDRG